MKYGQNLGAFLLVMVIKMHLGEGVGEFLSPKKPKALINQKTPQILFVFQSTAQVKCLFFFL